VRHEGGGVASGCAGGVGEAALSLIDVAAAPSLLDVAAASSLTIGQLC
jgi:hypothetical protein